MMGDRTEHQSLYLNKYKPWMCFFYIYFHNKKVKKRGKITSLSIRVRWENTVHCLFVNMTNGLFVARMRKKYSKMT